MLLDHTSRIGNLALPLIKVLRPCLFIHRSYAVLRRFAVSFTSCAGMRLLDSSSFTNGLIDHSTIKVSHVLKVYSTSYVHAE
jgi:hypothetical protein